MNCPNPCLTRGLAIVLAVVDEHALLRSDPELAQDKCVHGRVGRPTGAAGRFPHNTPDSKEAYWFRSVFEQHFPLASAAQTVPGGPTVACSTPEAILWDKTLQELNDPSGRAMKNVHKDSY